MDDERKPLLIAGLGLIGFAGWQLLQQKPAATGPPVTCPSGQHLEGGVCVQDPAPPGPVLDTRPTVTAIDGLLVRAGPGTAYRVVGSLPYGTHVTIACQTMGAMVIRSAVWDQVSSPIAGYVSDWYVSTPNVGSFSPGYRVCSAAPPGPVSPPAAISRQSDLRVGMIVSDSCVYGTADYVLDPELNLQNMVKRVIPTQAAWNLCNFGPRSVIRIVTPALLRSIPTGPPITGASVFALLGWRDCGNATDRTPGQGYCG
jgi:Bacterial SH3 domain